MYEKSTDMYFFHELMQLYYYLHCSSLSVFKACDADDVFNSLVRSHRLAAIRSLFCLANCLAAVEPMRLLQ